ncbi:hypothetical protein J2X77_003504 [Sphingobacterium sp. 2149]|uniref:Uncharacterized protein n=1 Tax=Sphingobacterium zeae TaxID=1776859 RepID=A0ABU0U7I4_9SPHI|nr:hypothetical protein [Sphingobacterium zeae]MDR6736631.1 hypothetical protein [Sphingobacterium sp. 2149]
MSQQIRLATFDDYPRMLFIRDGKRGKGYGNKPHHPHASP